MNQPLPLSILMPTRNVMSELSNHINSILEWADLVEEIIVVDSCSNDGTPEFIEEKLKHPKIKILSHPPGIYASWNYGLRQISSKYTYISTIGDLISREGLLHLVETADRFQADVVLSRPRFIDQSGNMLSSFRWPIHEIVDELAIKEPIALPTEQAVYYAIKFGAHSILGSSASNLYRTEVLQKNPWPEDFGGAGDTAWGILNASKVRFAITPRQFSSFILDPKYQSESNDGFPTKVFWLSCQVFTEIMAGNSQPNNLATDAVQKKLREAIVESGRRILHEGQPFEKLNGKLQQWAESAEARLSVERQTAKELQQKLKEAETSLVAERKLALQSEMLLAEERKLAAESNRRTTQSEELLAEERKQISQRIAQVESLLDGERKVSGQWREQAAQIERLLSQERSHSEKMKALLDREHGLVEELKTFLDQERTLVEKLRQTIERNEALLNEERGRAERLKKQWWIRLGRHASFINWDKFYRL